MTAEERAERAGRRRRFEELLDRRLEVDARLRAEREAGEQDEQNG